MDCPRSILKASQGSFSGGMLARPCDTDAIHVSIMSNATRWSLSLNSYTFDQPNGAYRRRSYKQSLVDIILYSYSLSFIYNFMGGYSLILLKFLSPRSVYQTKHPRLQTEEKEIPAQWRGTIQARNTVWPSHWVLATFVQQKLWRTFAEGLPLYRVEVRTQRFAMHGEGSLEPLGLFPSSWTTCRTMGKKIAKIIFYVSFRAYRYMIRILISSTLENGSYVRRHIKLIHQPTWSWDEGSGYATFSPMRRAMYKPSEHSSARPIGLTLPQLQSLSQHRYNPRRNQGQLE